MLFEQENKLLQSGAIECYCPKSMSIKRVELHVF